MHMKGNTPTPPVEEIEEVRPYRYFEQPLTQRVHHFYLTGVIEEPELYIDMVHKIRLAPAEDVVHIHINTIGGNLATGVQLINAMKTSQAGVICSLEAEAYSLGTLIFLAADEWIVHENCLMMFHNYSSGVWGKGNEQAAQIEASVKWFTELARDVYEPFLSEEEVERICKGEDLWLRTPEIRGRLQKMVKIMEKEHKAAIKKSKG